MNSFLAELKQYTFLISIMVALFIIKMLVIPIIYWQNDTVAQNIALSKRLAKAESLIGRKQDNTQFNQQLDSILTEADKIMFLASSEVEFKLEVQQLLEKSLAEKRLNLERISWTPAINESDQRISRYRVDTVISGDTFKLIEFVAKIDTDLKFVISKFNIDLRQVGGGRGQSNARISFNVYLGELNE
jgi:hypothetical protein